MSLTKLLFALFLVRLVVCAQVNPAPASAPSTSNPAQPAVNAGTAGPSQNEPLTLRTALSEIETSGSALASLCGAAISIIAVVFTLWRSSALANRTLRVEAQKLLLEINKQYLANPELLAIYDSEYDGLKARGFQIHGSLFKHKLRALAYMKLNVFEIVFAVHPGIDSRWRKVFHVFKGQAKKSAWEEYFAQSITKCTLVRKELEAHSTLYNESLLIAFRKYNQNDPQRKEPDYDQIVPSASPREELVKRLADGIVATLQEYVNPQNPKFEETVQRIVKETMEAKAAAANLGH